MLNLLRGAEETNYPYAVARVQAKRSRLLDAETFAKVLKMDVSEITRFIEDSAYKADVDELASRFEGLDLLEAALTVNEERTHQEVRRLMAGEGKDLISLYLSRYMVEDLKTLLRGKLAGATRDELLKELLLEDLDTYNVFQPLLGDDIKTPDDVATALGRQGGSSRQWGLVLESVPAGSPLNTYEDALDRAYYAQLLATVKEATQTGSELLLEFTRREIDIVNILNAARWVAAGQRGDFSPYVIPGGKRVDVAKVVDLSRSQDLTAFAEGARELQLGEEATNGLEAAVQRGRLAPFQAGLWREHLQALDRFASGNPLSIVPILVFLTRKHREVRALRAVARGRAAGLSAQRLEELIA